MKLVDILKEIKILESQTGQAAGKLELVKINLETAIDHIDKIGGSVDAIPNFEKNFKLAQSKASIGKTRRKDMPVITDVDVKKFQQRLKDGHIDIHKPFSDDTSPSDPFPEGLSGKDAEKFLKSGLRDGSKTDDMVKVSMKKETVKNLKPIQKQIYFDKAVGEMFKYGIEPTRSFLQKTTFITSSDNFIIDGHHRFIMAILLDPNITVNCLVVDLPINKLLPMAVAYGDAIGNKRNL